MASRGGYEPVNVLVVGETGDGKSTLVKSLRDPNQSDAPLVGVNPEGVTKDVRIYPGVLPNGRPFNLIDTPGVGDHNVTPVALTAMLEATLNEGNFRNGIRGVIVTTKISDCRVRLGAQVVQILVEQGFVTDEGGVNKWQSIILTGTMRDRATEDEQRCFMHGSSEGRSVRQVFYQAAGGELGPTVMVQKEDYTALLEAIQALPAVPIVYRQPPVEQMSAALAQRLGMERSRVEEALAAMRVLVEQQAAQLRDALQLQEQIQQRHAEDLARRDQQIEEMRRDMQNQEARAAEAQRAHQEEVRRMHEETQQLRREEAQRRAEQQAQNQRVMEQQAAVMREQLQALQNERTEMSKNYNSLMLEMQRQNAAQAAQAVAVRSSGPQPCLGSEIARAVGSIGVAAVKAEKCCIQ